MYKAFLLALMAQAVAVGQPPTCDVVLTACKAVVDQDTTQLTHMNQSIKDLEDQLAKDEKTPLLPWWAVAGLSGFVAGMLLGSKLK
jgi:hypothetical protein